MYSKSIFVIVLAAVAFCAAAPVFAQVEMFTDPSVEYSFQVPESTWKMTVKPSATSPNVEYVYRDRTEGHLEVRRIPIAKDSMLADLVQSEEQKLQFRPGFVAGKEENFVGRVRGTVFNFEFVASGRSMAGRFYFLKFSDSSVYVLRFTGQKDSIRGLRNQTDLIARTFGVK